MGRWIGEIVVNAFGLFSFDGYWFGLNIQGYVFIFFQKFLGEGKVRQMEIYY